MPVTTEVRPEVTPHEHPQTGGAAAARGLSLLGGILAIGTLGAYAGSALKFVLQNFATVMAAERWALNSIETAVREPEAGGPAVAAAVYVIACIIAIIIMIVETKYQIVRQIRQHLRVVVARCNWAGGWWAKFLCVLTYIYVIVVSVVVIIVAILVAVIVYINLIAILG